jgi:hypothetical protein
VRRLIGLVVLVVMVTAPAAAQDDDRASGGDADATTSSTASLVLVEQSAWVGEDGTFDLRLGVDGAPLGAQLSVQVYPSVRSRTGFAQSIDGDNLGTPIRPLPPVLPVDLLPREPDGSIRLTFPVSTTDPPPLGMRVTGQGVFPVLVSLLDGDGNDLDHFVTHLVRLPTVDSTAPPLAFSLVVPFAGPPGFAPDGRPSIAETDAERLMAAGRALARTPTVPVVVDPVPETIDALASAGEPGAGMVASLSTALAGRQVLGGPYVRIDIGAWVASTDPSAPDELTRQATTGSDVIGALLGVRPDTRTAIVDRTVTPDALTRLRAMGVDQLVIPEDQLGPLSGEAAQVTFTQRFDVVNGEGRTMRSVMADDGLADRLTATSDPVLNAHLVIADLAVLFFDRPNLSRGAVLLVPRELMVPEATYDALLTGLSRPSVDDGIVEGGHQIIAPLTVDDLFDVTDPATTSARGNPVLVRPYDADAPASLGGLPADVATTRAHIASFTTMVASGAGVTLVPGLDRQVLIAEALGLDDQARAAYLGGVVEAIDSQLAAIVTPSDQRVTLTDRSGDVPLTIENQLDYAVDVDVVLTSAKLEFPDGNVRRVNLPPASSTVVNVAVEAKASGAFPVDVRIQSPDGSRLVGSARYTVRSTAVSGIGLLLSIGAGIFLLVWWARHFRSIRRGRRLVSPDHPSMRRGPTLTTTGAADADEPAPTGR